MFKIPKDAEYPVLIDKRFERTMLISRIQAEFLIQLDVPFDSGVMIARWSGRSL
jgi:hypothetical protein